MRILSVLAACAMTWAASVGVVDLRAANDEVAPPGEITLCLVPMGSGPQAFGTCTERPSSWLGGGERSLSPE